jgi:hypothetical protein
MKHGRELIHTARHQWEEYLNEESYVREIAAALQKLDVISNKWPAEEIVDEAYYQARALLLDFGPKMEFKADYYDEARQRMGRKVANAVYAVTYRLLDHFDVLEELRRQIAKAVTPSALCRLLKVIPQKTFYLDFYPRTPYFANSDFVNWRYLTDNFFPANVNRILVLARTYEYPQLVAKGILGQLRAYALKNNALDDLFLQESEELLKAQLTEEQILQVYVGDDVQNELYHKTAADIKPSDYEANPQALAELARANDELTEVRKEIEEKKQLLAQAQAENAQRMRESEEYKAAIKEMEEQLGRSYISFNKIAECILRLPTFQMQTQALQYVNFLLTGTGWSAKAEEVMNRMFAQVKEHSEKYEVHIGTLNNNGTLNEISGSTVQLPDAGPDLPKIAQ